VLLIKPEEKPKESSEAIPAFEQKGKPEKITEPVSVLPAIPASPPAVSQPVYAGQVKYGEQEKPDTFKTKPVKKLPDWETVDSVLNRPVIYDK
jgi:hypothetical protein